MPGKGKKPAGKPGTHSPSPFQTYEYDQRMKEEQQRIIRERMNEQQRILRDQEEQLRGIRERQERAYNLQQEDMQPTQQEIRQRQARIFNKAQEEAAQSAAPPYVSPAGSPLPPYEDFNSPGAESRAQHAAAAAVLASSTVPRDSGQLFAAKNALQKELYIQDMPYIDSARVYERSKKIRMLQQDILREQLMQGTQNQMSELLNRNHQNTIRVMTNRSLRFVPDRAAGVETQLMGHMSKTSITGGN